MNREELNAINNACGILKELIKKHNTPLGMLVVDSWIDKDMNLIKQTIEELDSIIQNSEEEYIYGF